MTDLEWQLRIAQIRRDQGFDGRVIPWEGTLGDPSLYRPVVATAARRVA